MRAMIPMLIAAAALACATVPAENTGGSVFEYPVVPAKILADSLAEKCPLCVKKLQKQAYEHLDRAFPPGTAYRGAAFAKEAAGKNLFAADGYGKRQHYRKDPEKGDIFLPRVLFRFHTASDHLVGIDTADFTADASVSAFRRLPARGMFRGTVTVIRFGYGDGRTFNYSPSDNTIYIHCRLDGIEPLQLKADSAP